MLVISTAHAQQASAGPRGHAWPKNSRGEAFPDDVSRSRTTAGHGHHTRRYAQERAGRAEPHGPAEPLGQRAEPEYPAHLR